MKAPGLIDGIIVAVGITLGAAVIRLLLGGFVAGAALYGLILSWASLVYILYLLRRSRARVGRIVVIAAWILLGFACWVLQLPLTEQMLLHAGFVWVLRSLYFHGSLLSAALDLGLVAAGLAAGAWALLNTGSLVAALWSFFLLQALFCWIPEFAAARSGNPREADAGATSFQSAHRVALAAVRKLTQQ